MLGEIIGDVINFFFQETLCTFESVSIRLRRAEGTEFCLIPIFTVVYRLDN